MSYTSNHWQRLDKHKSHISTHSLPPDHLHHFSMDSTQLHQCLIEFLGKHHMSGCHFSIHLHQVTSFIAPQPQQAAWTFPLMSIPSGSPSLQAWLDTSHGQYFPPWRHVLTCCKTPRICTQCMLCTPSSQSCHNAHYAMTTPNNIYHLEQNGRIVPTPIECYVPTCQWRDLHMVWESLPAMLPRDPSKISWQKNLLHCQILNRFLEIQQTQTQLPPLVLSVSYHLCTLQYRRHQQGMVGTDLAHGGLVGWCVTCRASSIQSS